MELRGKHRWEPPNRTLQTALVVFVGLVVLSLFSCLTLIIVPFFLTLGIRILLIFFQEQVLALLIFLDYMLIYLCFADLRFYLYSFISYI